ncbi:Nitroreductase-like protein [Aspergillus undulatus]|uniref:Nitroreductase-like protein n=1 Tax=Aspergillus undulatus TaxID=1810928 RepID=UPI003CCE4F00
MAPQVRPQFSSYTLTRRYTGSPDHRRPKRIDVLHASNLERGSRARPPPQSCRSETKRRPRLIRQAPVIIYFCADLSRLSNVSAWEGQPGKALDKMDMFITATIDAALASQNVALAAQSMGLGICYVGGARNNAAQLCELLKLPDRVIALFGMAIGVPDPENLPAVKPRLALQEVLHKETWDDQDQQENVEMYNWSLEKFYDWRQLVGRQSWATFVSKTLASGDLDGRERIRQVLLDRGFGLE